MPDDTNNNTPSTVQTEVEGAIRNLNREAFLAKLKESNITLEQFLDFEDPSKRIAYMKHVKSEDALPQPTATEEAESMAGRAFTNSNNSKVQGILELLKNQMVLRYEDNPRTIARRQAEIIRQAPWYLMWTARTVLFFKRLFNFKRFFKRSK
jgi:monoamine oxidase